MSTVLEIEDPVTTRTHTVWLGRGENDPWGDAWTYGGERFRPNRACVIVREHAGRFESNWMQVRRHYFGDPAHPAQEMCAEVAMYEGYWIENEGERWAMAVRDYAVQVAKEHAGA